MKPFRPSVLLLLLVLLAGCAADERCPNGSERWDAEQQACVAVSIEVPAPLGSAESNRRLDQDSTATYIYSITYPDSTRLPAPLWNTLRDWAASRKQEFLNVATTDADSSFSATLPWGFQLGFEMVLSSNRFISLLAEGYEYTGGAHGMPSYETFNYDRQQDRSLTLDALLTDSTALASISQHVQTEIERGLIRDMSGDEEPDSTVLDGLRDWIREGTAPTRANYEQFLLTPDANGQPAGLIVLFPPYQVAPYAAGLREVFVPSSVFASHLRPAYAQAFTSNPPVLREVGDMPEP